MANLEIITSKWQQAAKTRGAENVVTLADGSTLNGCYYLTESGAATASHDVLNGFGMSQGFPTDENGRSVNDRDYQRDRDAQRITREIARNYDGRAIQSPVIVSPDGIVLSGNGRTMAGELAAHDGTDGAYINHLAQYGRVYGFNAADVAEYKHPRLLFVLSENLPYTAATFARFNAKDMKSQSKTEQAVKFGKLVDDATFGRITSTINAFETLGDFYANTEAATRCLNDLRLCGVIDAMGYAELFDGDTISAQGRETLENVLIGKAFAADPDAARKITAFKSLRKSVTFCLSEIANNLVLANGYDLKNELAEAVNLAYVARQHGYKAGERVSAYARQIDAFSTETVCDYRNTTALILADALNNEQVTLLRRILAVYNHHASDSANGQTDMFAMGDGIRTKADILEDVKTLFATGDTNEQKQAETSAKEARLSENIFISDEQATRVMKGGYVEYMTLSGEAIICQVEDIKGVLVFLSAKGGIRFCVSRDKVRPTAEHLLNLPSWLSVGSVLTDGKRYSQKVADINDGIVTFDWINGGVFMATIAVIIQNWKPSETGVCRLIEAA